MRFCSGPLTCALAASVSLGAFASAEAEARSISACKEAWSKAVRSYLTDNRRAAPDGTIPDDLDEIEAASQAWEDAFQPACDIEQAGDKPAARVEAAALGVRILARLDRRGCARFLEFFMESTRPSEICQAAAAEASMIDLRRDVEASIPIR